MLGCGGSRGYPQATYTRQVDGPVVYVMLGCGGNRGYPQATYTRQGDGPVVCCFAPVSLFLKMDWTSACFQDCGTRPAVRDLLNKRVRLGVTSLANDWRKRHGIPPGPAAFL